MGRGPIGANTPQRNLKEWLLCPKCRSHISVIESDGREKIVIEIYRAPTQPALPSSSRFKAVEQEVKALERDRRRASLKRAFRAGSMHMMEETLHFGREHKWDLHITAQALGVNRTSLVNRLRRYELRGWIRKNHNGWIKADQWPGK